MPSASIGCSPMACQDHRTEQPWGTRRLDPADGNAHADGPAGLRPSGPQHGTLKLGHYPPTGWRRRAAGTRSGRRTSPTDARPKPAGGLSPRGCPVEALAGARERGRGAGATSGPAGVRSRSCRLQAGGVYTLGEGPPLCAAELARELLAARGGASGAESRGAGHHGDLMTAVALAVWWQGLARM